MDFKCQKEKKKKNKKPSIKAKKKNAINKDL